MTFLNWLMTNYMQGLLLLFGTGFLLIMSALCYLLWWKMWKNEIKLDALLEEVNGQASMARFQLLVFTLVVAAGLFMYLLKHANFPDIPSSVLYLVGISATTYGTSKAISYSRDEGVTTEQERDKNRAAEVTVRTAAAQAQAVESARVGPVAGAAAEGAFAGAVAGQGAGAGGGNVVVMEPAPAAAAAPADGNGE
jgi:hypothetical protein